MKYSKKCYLCNEFFNDLVDLLDSWFEVVGSCNQDMSKYLIPIGTEKEITYHSKPAWSFRISDHWNWYSSLKKCRNEKYMQCYSLDLPNPKERNAPGKASDPIKAVQVAICDEDGIYHHVFGDKYDPETKTWSFVENNPVEVLKAYL